MIFPGSQLLTVQAASNLLVTTTKPGEPMKSICFRATALWCVSAACLPAAAQAQDLPVYTKISWRAECPSEPKVQAKGLFGSLFAAVAPKLIGGAVDAAATALTEAGKNKEISSTARTEGYFYNVTAAADQLLDTKMNCVVVQHGRFATTQAEEATESWFRFEARTRPVAGLKFFQLEPVYVKASRFAEKRWFGPDKRSYSVALALSTPGAAAPFASATFNFTDLAEGEELKPGDWRLAQARSQPLALPADMPDVKREVEEREKAIAPYLIALDILGPAKPVSSRPPSVLGQDAAKQPLNNLCDAIITHNGKVPRQFALNDDRCAFAVDTARAVLDAKSAEIYRNADAVAWAKKQCPRHNPTEDQTLFAACGKDNPPKYAVKALGFFSTNTTLVETRPGSRFAAFLGAALSASKDDVTKAVVSRVVPDSTPVDTAAEEAAARDARRSLALADLAVAKAEDLLAEALSAVPSVASKVTQARIDLLNARIAANNAYRTAGLPVPFPSAD
jgi:hypothetical protein